MLFETTHILIKECNCLKLDELSFILIFTFPKAFKLVVQERSELFGTREQCSEHQHYRRRLLMLKSQILMFLNLKRKSCFPYFFFHMIKVSSKNEASGEERSVNTLRSRVWRDYKITIINIFSLFLCDCAI